MDLLQQFLVGFVGNMLPQGGTLANVNAIEEGRIDALVSHGVAHLVGQAANPLVKGIYLAARPLIDGALVASCGPAALAPKIRGVAAKRSNVVANRRKTHQGRKAKVERTKDGVEILDAEFVDVK